MQIMQMLNQFINGGNGININNAEQNTEGIE